MTRFCALIIIAMNEKSTRNDRDTVIMILINMWVDRDETNGDVLSELSINFYWA